MKNVSNNGSPKNQSDSKIIKKGKAKVAAAVLLFLAAAVLAAVFMGKVAINYNLADYLGSDTQTKTALDIIDDEFGMTGSIQVMVKNVSEETADEMLEKLENIPNVLNVSFDKYSETYYKDGNALFLVIIDGDDYSENAKQVTSDIKSAFSAYEGAEYGGTAVEKQSLQDAITSEMIYILAISLCLVVAILLITSESWLEPFILLAASGVAVLINRGTNVFFGEISYITNSISAILQLALSIDYSIVLLHTYRREKESGGDNKYAAMKAAVMSVIKPISASALTTIAGLLALLFMSFRIGFDIGIVLMKGIVISALTSLTLLPALVLLFDRPMKRAHKKAFVPKGKAFCRIAYKAGKVIVPSALALIIVCGVLQSGNTYIFTDTKAGNKAISDVFGSNNSVVVVYGNKGENGQMLKNFENEKTLADALEAYRTKSGNGVLTDYTAYTNTVREIYDIKKATQKLELSEKDAEMLFTMYNLYRSPSDVRITFAELVDFADSLVDSDADAKEFTDDGTVKALKTMKLASEVLSGEYTAEELYEKLTTGVMEGTDIELFSVKQLYGMYFYDKVGKKEVGFETMLAFLISTSENENVGDMLDAETVAKLKMLSDGIAQFRTQMEMPMDKATLKGWIYQNSGTLLTDEQLDLLYTWYFASTGEPAGETIPFLSVMKFLAAGGYITDDGAVATLNGYDALYTAIGSEYGYEEFFPALLKIATALSGQTPQISLTDENETVKQLYIMYFYQTGTMPEGKMSGKTFAEYALATDSTNSVVHGQLTDENRGKLADILTVRKYIEDTAALTYEDAYEKLSALQEEIKSGVAAASLDKDKISGAYIKYAIYAMPGKDTLSSPVMACDLLDFVSGNMDTNTLLMQKMSDENRRKVADAQADIDKAEELFLGENYSRMLLSVDLPNESGDTTEFVGWLSDEVKHIFGDDAYITGEIVSTYDLESSFDRDNRFITVFTLISIFVIVMVIFRSLSLPVILVAVIQGAIFIAMSTQLVGSGIFFMSYIVTTCILMGATIDYGILMSSNYVAYRNDHDRKKALELSVGAAMPTVFTSGLILTVCGFVIHFISSQNSISTVGLLIGIGTVCSVIMITVVLPSVLYLLDGFVLKLSFKRKR